jgi:gamma-glutamyltranspeptidase/glutathione hydrolase
MLNFSSHDAKIPIYPCSDAADAFLLLFGGACADKEWPGYQAKEREPVVFGYKDRTVITMPLPGSGGVLLQQMMKMAEMLPMKSYGFESVRAVHFMTEIERLAYADRAKWLGDRDFYAVPVDALTGESYLRQRMALIDPVLAGHSRDIQAGVIPPEHKETTHLDVVDGEGNAVSITTTLNGGYGSSVVVGGAGFLLNNEMDDFSSKPGTPNMFGAIGGDANAIAPGKRMLSSMTPTIVLDKGRVELIIGTPRRHDDHHFRLPDADEYP